MSRTVALLCSFLALPVGCDDGEERRAEETGRLVEAVQAITHDAPMERRHEMVDALAAVELTDEGLQQTQQTCIDGHRALLTAEEQQHTATLALARATDGDPEANAIAPEQAAEIEDAIRRSQDATSEARDLLTRCQDEVTDLEIRRSAHR